MKKKNLFSCVALLLAVVMVVGLFAGCNTEKPVETNPKETQGGTNKPAETDPKEEAPKEIVTLEIFAGTPGTYENLWWTEILEEKLGVRVQLVGMDKELLDTYIASGDLPDIMRIDDPETQKLAYEAGLLVNFDEKKDLLPNVYELYPAGALQFQRDKYSDGGLYTLPVGPDTAASTYGWENYATRLDFEYYLEYVKANGEPELEDIEDFIPVLKWIQEKYPTNEDGQAAYGMTIFSDWDGGRHSFADYIAQQYGVKQVGYNEINMDTLESISIFDDASYYKRMLKFLFDANQAGILDPDSMTQTWDDYQAKIKSRRSYSSFAFTMPDQVKIVPFKNQNSVNMTAAPQIGHSSGTWGFCVSANSEYVDLACQFLNFIIDEENWWELCFGPQGEYWDVNEQGQPYVTEFGKQMDADPNVKFSTGGNISDATAIKLWNWRPLSVDHVYSQYGVTYNTSAWPTASEEDKDEISKLWEQWLVDVHGFKHPGGTVSELTAMSGLGLQSAARAGATGAAAPDALVELAGRLKAVVPTMSWQMVYATSEAEFESIWDAMVEQVTEMGVDEYNKWYLEDYLAGIEGYEKYCY